MSSNIRTILFVAIILVLLIVNVVPLRQGEALICPQSAKTDAHVITFGIPFSFLSTKGSHSECATTSEKQNLAPKSEHNYYFDTASVWFDLLIDGMILLGAYYILGQKRILK
jgi:hypothetical protein